ncbi:MAG TPA: YceH family protein [Solirubrobacteraceae bacterium]|jgi:hypothetical protein|nr:YceH family protein [Solirubrobacteraceae bacterium]
MDLSASETRVLGCLLEKQRTTPDAYPLSLNALRLACNQSTNRDPVVSYEDPIIRDALHRLERRGFVRLASGAGSRAAKYRHLLAEALPMSSEEQAVMCVLMLRGPQTPGELKQRGERMHAFADLAAVHATLERLIGRELVRRLERRPGHKEERYAQLLQDSEGEAGAAPSSARADLAAGAGRAPAAAAAAVEPATRVAEPPAGVGESSAGAGEPSAGARGPLAGARGGDELAQLRERVTRLEREVADLRAGMRDPVYQP